MKRFFVCMILVLLALAPASAVLAAGDQNFELEQREQESLNEEASEAYLEGIDHLDHVRYQEALDRFIAATQAQPDHVGLRFLVAKMAVAEARTVVNNREGVNLYGSTEGEECPPNLEGIHSAEDLFDLAIEHLSVVPTLRGKTARRADVERAERTIQTIARKKANQDKLEDRREEVGEAIVKEYVDKYYVDEPGKAQ